MTHPVRDMQVLPVRSVVAFEGCGTSGPGAGDGRL